MRSLRVAHHEAAHAVVAVHLGAEVAHVRIDSKGDGSVSFRRQPRRQLRAVVVMAGAAAEFHFGHAEKLEAVGSDARAIAILAGGNAEQAGVEALALVKRFEREIHEVARVLADSDVQGRELHEWQKVWNNGKASA